MARDKPDPTLIVEGSRRAHPSKRVQGHDYPTTALEELEQREKGMNTHPSLDLDFNANHRDPTVFSNPQNRTKNTVDTSLTSTAWSSSNAFSSSHTKEKKHLKDSTKPDGEACNTDGTLKDASELQWPDSPTQPMTLELPNVLDTEAIYDVWTLDKNNAPRASAVSNRL
jgi:hypothetical protein